MQTLLGLGQSLSLGPGGKSNTVGEGACVAETHLRTAGATRQGEEWPRSGLADIYDYMLAGKGEAGVCSIAVKRLRDK